MELLSHYWSGTAEVNKIEDDTADIKPDINVFSQVALGYGYRRVNRNRKDNCSTILRKEDMKTIFKEHVTHMTDGSSREGEIHIIWIIN